MSKQYNLYNLEASYKKYLIAGKYAPISIKNYLSDFRHFIGWLINIFNIAKYKYDINLITQSDIEKYKEYLVANLLPIKTINRRLCSVRKIFTFLINQGYYNNTVILIRNYQSKNNLFDNGEKIIDIYESFLKDNNNNPTAITQSISVIKDLLTV